MTKEEAKQLLEDIVICDDPELEEAIKIAIEALENAEKYKWHDLRKHPEDLPPKRGQNATLCENYEFVIEGKEAVVQGIGWINESYGEHGTGFVFVSNAVKGKLNRPADDVYRFNPNKLIAWREKELFEEKE